MTKMSTEEMVERAIKKIRRMSIEEFEMCCLNADHAPIGKPSQFVDNLVSLPPLPQEDGDSTLQIVKGRKGAPEG